MQAHPTIAHSPRSGSSPPECVVGVRGEAAASQLSGLQRGLEIVDSSTKAIELFDFHESPFQESGESFSY